jgi:hypothetical protein
MYYIQTARVQKSAASDSLAPKSPYVADASASLRTILSLVPNRRIGWRWLVWRCFHTKITRSRRLRLQRNDSEGLWVRRHIFDSHHPLHFRPSLANAFPDGAGFSWTARSSSGRLGESAFSARQARSAYKVLRSGWCIGRIGAAAGLNILRCSDGGAPVVSLNAARSASTVAKPVARAIALSD